MPYLFNYKILGSVFLMLGTCIGAGMLALPVSTAAYGFNTIFIYLISSWLLMTIGAFALLEVNLWMEPGSNLFTMSKNTLGKIGNIISVIIYLLLLYSLISAYIAAASDILQGILSEYDIKISYYLSIIYAFTFLFLVISLGIKFVDMANRVLMLVKISAFFTMICLIILVIYNNPNNFVLSNYINHQTENNILNNMGCFMLMITAFGFAIILPSLRAYLDDNHKSLIKTLSIGCFIPIIVYIIWILAVYSIIPNLIEIGGSANPNSELINAISHNTGYLFLIRVSKTFISICAITSFLGVALCLVDFVKDIVDFILKKYCSEFFLDLQLDYNNSSYHKHQIFYLRFFRNLLIYIISFSIPLFIVFSNPGIFIKILSYAGILVLLFLVIVPLCMLYRGRYYLDYVGQKLIPGGKFVNILLLFISIILLALGIYELLLQ